jgi:serine protease inhibitor
LGITDVFSDTTANFSGLVSGIEAKPYVTDVEHAARVTIDEDGVTAAAYTLILVAGAAAPDPDQKEIDFTLDRPFLFVIESDNMPLFAGVVNDP